ncbi:unnamed protein product [Vicia faba]|uniref:Uncharacterized protein n=1 Tax=Vicia faba TaxID=3906 RepID=A0AAV1B7E1_VICFA|nr:unnamed protein product [Vicia faba]
MHVIHCYIKENFTLVTTRSIFQTLDRETALKAIVESQRPHIERLREKGVHPYLHFTGSFINCSVFITFFLAIANMAEKMPSFKHGGAFWFTDLTTPDALYILPVLTGLSYLVIVECDMQKGTEGIPISEKKKNISRALALLIVPIAMSFPKVNFPSQAFFLEGTTSLCYILLTVVTYSACTLTDVSYLLVA